PAGTGADPTASALARGGALISSQGWFRFDLTPPCPRATLLVDGADGAALRPRLPGVHAFELRVPDPAACSLPLHVALSDAAGKHAEVILLSPRAAAVSEARPAPMREDAGYVHLTAVAKLDKTPLGLGADASGEPLLLLHRDGRWELRALS